MVIGIGVIAGTECVILANDPSVLGGALTPMRGRSGHGLEIARDNRMPYVSFVESAAPTAVETDNGGGRKVNTTHFAESGRFFYELIELSKMRIRRLRGLRLLDGGRATSRACRTTTSW